MTKNKGFTLIEVIIVLAIIGILAAITIPQFYAKKERARGCPVELVQSISDITKVDVDPEKQRVVIHTATAVYYYTPIDLSKGTKIDYRHTNVYHQKPTQFCTEYYYFEQGD